MRVQKKLREMRGVVKRLKKSLSYETGQNRPIDPGDSSYPNATDVAECLRRCDEDLLTEARFVLWQENRIKELEAKLKEK
jgi:hypothetical protein